MGDKTRISWTDATWTTVTGCSRVSPGCGGPGPHGGCYAEVLSARKLANLPQYKGVAHVVGGKDDGGKVVGGEARWTGLVRTHPDRLDQPLRWKRARRIFVNSMSDTFHADVPNEFIAAIFGVAAACPQHRFQLLTKRAERLPEWFAWLQGMVERSRSVFPADPDGWLARHVIANRARHFGAPSTVQASGDEWPLPNVAIGVSVEDQQRADERIPLLLQVPNACPWVSIEPLIGQVDLGPFLHGIRWAVIGGESGPRYREMDLAWLRSLADQCQQAGVATFVKQMSGPRPGKQGSIPDDLWLIKGFPSDS